MLAELTQLGPINLLNILVSPVSRNACRSHESHRSQNIGVFEFNMIKYGIKAG